MTQSTTKRLCSRCQIMPARWQKGGLCDDCRHDKKYGAATMAERGIPATLVEVRSGGIVRWVRPELTPQARETRMRALAAKRAVMATPRVPLAERIAAAEAEQRAQAERRAQEAADQIWARIAEQRANAATFQRMRQEWVA